MNDIVEPAESPAAPLLRYMLSPLGRWLDDPRTQDIAIQEPGVAWIFASGQWHREDVALSLADLEEIAILAGSLRKQDVGQLTPLCATELPNGERLQICIPPTVPQGSVSLTIRKHEQTVAPLSRVKERYRLNDWNAWRATRGRRSLAGLLAFYDAGDFEGFLMEAVRARLNILLAGSTGSGKTTLSKSILAAIDHAERLITIEDTVELTILQPNVVRLLYSKDDLSGTEINAETLLQASLRMRPARVLLQELRDDAAWTYLTSICSGHPGSCTTIHGDDPADAVRRLFLLVKASEAGRALEREVILGLIASAIDVIIPLREKDGEFNINSTWFVADAARRGETAANLLSDA
jgi:type IV secretion system protein VirB11